ncbi:MAG: ABC transporter ATP-binding protein [Treponema sp.]|nr:ABC transporter ATP-binding protein [Treponema sp.]
MSETVIKVENATVRFNMTSEKVDNIKEYFIKFIKRQLRYNELIALNNVSFDVKKGESWGIIGRNGAGKSTLLRVICSIISPNKGNVHVNGTISPMLELGAGFDANLSARENVFLEGSLLGRSRDYMKEHYNEIVEFSELADFMEMPVKNYSSGMRARIAFSIATAVKPKILIVDEVLAVGDTAFRRKCEDRIQKMLEGEVTLLLVSHNSAQIEKLCNKALWLRDGEVVMTGDSKEVCAAYENYYK